MKKDSLLNFLRENGYFIGTNDIRRKCKEAYSLNIDINHSFDSQILPLSLIFDNTKYEFELHINKSKDYNSIESIPKTILSYDIIDNTYNINGKVLHSKQRKNFSRKFDPSKDHFYDLEFFVAQNNAQESFLSLRQELIKSNQEYSHQFLSQEAKKLSLCARPGFMNKYRVATFPADNLLKKHYDPTLIFWSSDYPDPPYWKEDYQTEGNFTIKDIIFNGKMHISNSHIQISISAEKFLNIQSNTFRTKDIAMGDPFNGETIIYNKVYENLAFVVFEKQLIILDRTITIRKLALDGFTHASIDNGNLKLYGRYRKHAPKYCYLFELSTSDEREYITLDGFGRLNVD